MIAPHEAKRPGIVEISRSPEIEAIRTLDPPTEMSTLAQTGARITRLRLKKKSAIFRPSERRLDLPTIDLPNAVIQTVRKRRIAMRETATARAGAARVWGVIPPKSAPAALE
jgi:hypothetical protein